MRWALEGSRRDLYMPVLPGSRRVARHLHLSARRKGKEASKFVREGVRLLYAA